MAICLSDLEYFTAPEDEGTIPRVSYAISEDGNVLGRRITEADGDTIYHMALAMHLEGEFNPQEGAENLRRLKWDW